MTEYRRQSPTSRVVTLPKHQQNDHKDDEAASKRYDQYTQDSHGKVPILLLPDDAADTIDYSKHSAGDDDLSRQQPAVEGLKISTELDDALTRHDSYPVNMSASRISDLSALTAAKERVSEMERQLFVQQEELVEVCIRDFHTGEGRPREKMNVHSASKLSSYLGIEEMESGEKSFLPRYRLRKRDPRCRLIYIFGQDSRSRLKIERRMLTKLLTYHQVMPDYLDYIFLFGAQIVPQDSRFSSFREQTKLRYWPGRTTEEALGRSGYQYQLCYNLKGVTLKSKHPIDQKLNQWSIRQAAIHHQFDVVNGTTLWIVTKGGRDILELFKQHTGPKGKVEDKTFDSLESCFISSLAIHRMFCSWATQSWRWYNRWLENTVLSETAIAVHELRESPENYKKFKPSDIQALQHRDEQNRDIVTSLESNITIVFGLRNYYSKLLERDDFPQGLKDSCKDAAVLFLQDLEAIIKEFEGQLTSAKVLAADIKNRMELIKQHMQTQTSDRIEKLNVNMEREAVAMKIITVLTLFFLPPTFVATLFSTDLIRYNNNQEAFSRKALFRWLEVSLPLTLITLVLAYVSYNFFQPHSAIANESQRPRFRWIPSIFRRPRGRLVNDNLIDKSGDTKRGLVRDKWSIADSLTSIKLAREKKTRSILGV